MARFRKCEKFVKSRAYVSVHTLTHAIMICAVNKQTLFIALNSRNCRFNMAHIYKLALSLGVYESGIQNH